MQINEQNSHIHLKLAKFEQQVWNWLSGLPDDERAKAYAALHSRYRETEAINQEVVARVKNGSDPVFLGHQSNALARALFEKALENESSGATNEAMQQLSESAYYFRKARAYNSVADQKELSKQSAAKDESDFQGELEEIESLVKEFFNDSIHAINGAIRELETINQNSKTAA